MAPIRWDPRRPEVQTKQALLIVKHPRCCDAAVAIPTLADACLGAQQAIFARHARQIVAVIME
jgi:hypothetical protein